MADEMVLGKQRFDSEAAASLVRELRTTFASGKTKSYEWRVSQLKGIAKLVADKENEIVEALHKDLAKPETEAHVTEISMLKSSCNHALKELKHWMKPEKVPSSILTFPSSAKIVSEPLGVVLVIAPWNYPFLLSLDPVLGAIVAGNAVVLKPSEISPATSSFFTKFLNEYVDRSAIRVVDGAVDEATALLERKWDKIFYTGSYLACNLVLIADVNINCFPLWCAANLCCLPSYLIEFCSGIFCCYNPAVMRYHTCNQFWFSVSYLIVKQSFNERLRKLFIGLPKIPSTFFLNHFALPLKSEFLLYLRIVLFSTKSYPLLEIIDLPPTGLVFEIIPKVLFASSSYYLILINYQIATAIIEYMLLYWLGPYRIQLSFLNFWSALKLVVED
ncbi:hypothetical protein NE237_019217 [Protea cynaroides]|uniref:Aldehyde dehydrogenase domain-containing protein n=1 Tax=Protea cynaroides TaxID=273540 RepID=A0A9Q0KBB2_9MAGN|nr:hypothetical protein NE237_019217 [Protea cynaroides]